MILYKNRKSSDYIICFLLSGTRGCVTNKTRTGQQVISACRKKEKKTYKYMPEIVERIVNMHLDDEQSLYRRAERGEHDPRNIASNMNIGPVPVPSTSEIVQKQHSRFH